MRRLFTVNNVKNYLVRVKEIWVEQMSLLFNDTNVQKNRWNAAYQNSNYVLIVLQTHYSYKLHLWPHWNYLDFYINDF